MGLSKRQITILIFCLMAYLALPALIFLAYSRESSTHMCNSIAVYTNGVTSLYYYNFLGKKSSIFVAVLGLIVNLIFLTLCLNGIFMNKFGNLSNEEVVFTIILIACSLTFVFYSIKKVREKM